MKLRKVFFQIAIIGAIFFFLGKYFLKNYHELSQSQLSLNCLYLLISILFFNLNGLLRPFIWKRILRFLGISLSYKEALEICSFSNLAGYIPGKIWPFLGRLYLTRDKHINQNIIVTSQGIESILMLLSGIIIFLFSLTFGLNMLFVKNIVWVVAFIPVLLISLYPPFLQILISWCSKIFHFESFRIDLNYLNIAEATLLFLVFWLFNGMAMFFLIRAMFFVAFKFLPITIGVYAVSSAIGFLSFLTPAGLGVKEGILSFLLSFYIPLTIAIIVSLLARVCTVAVELVRAGVIVIVKKFSLLSAKK